jgi:biopolymer transport protein ExbD
MAGVDVGGGGKGGKKALDSEINMVPFIDLLMVTISFLLITAVWSHMSRINANAQVPGPPRPDEEMTQVEPEPSLHVEMRDQNNFKLIWKTGSTVVSDKSVPRKAEESRDATGKITGSKYPDLAAEVEEQWKMTGKHRDASDKKFDQAVLHTDNETKFSDIVAVIDAIYKTHRPINSGKPGDSVPAFNVTFAVN